MASAMSLSPSARPQQADELARVLRRFLSGVDLGDVARQLGERVRKARAHPPTPPSGHGPVLQRPPSRPIATQVGTKTFAARSEVQAWKPGASAMEGSSTRRLASNEPPADARGRRLGLPTRNLVWRGIFGAATIALVAFLVGRGAATSTAKSATPPASVPSATATPSTTPSPPAASIALATPPATTAPNGDAPDRAHLVLLGDGTYVTVDGVSRGSAPTRIALEPGAHTILFAFPATGESKGASLTLHSGDHATMRADFTGAKPTIRVER